LHTIQLILLSLRVYVLIIINYNYMKVKNNIQSAGLKKFVKPAMEIIDMTPCTIVTVSQPDDDPTPPSSGTGGFGPGGYVPPMGWGGE